MARIRSLYASYCVFLQKLNHDCVSAYAAQAAFYIMVSFFPFCMFLLSLVQFFPITRADILIAIKDNLPSAISPYLIDVVKEIYRSSNTTLLSITIITTLWAASKAFYSLIYGLNAVYNIAENRNYFVLRFFATIYTIIFAAMLLGVLVLLVFGNSIVYAIKNAFPALQDAALLLVSIRASASFCILILFFLYLYVLIPNRKSRILAELPGAIFSSVSWIAFSYLYSFYIDQMSNFSNTYGSLTAIVLLMLWLYFCMYILLLGGEINDCLRRISIVNRILGGKAKHSEEDA